MVKRFAVLSNGERRRLRGNILILIVDILAVLKLQYPFNISVAKSCFNKKVTLQLFTNLVQIALIDIGPIIMRDFFSFFSVLNASAEFVIFHLLRS